MCHFCTTGDRKWNCENNDWHLIRVLKANNIQVNTKTLYITTQFSEIKYSIDLLLVGMTHSLLNYNTMLTCTSKTPRVLVC